MPPEAPRLGVLGFLQSPTCQGPLVLQLCILHQAIGVRMPKKHFEAFRGRFGERVSTYICGV